MKAMTEDNKENDNNKNIFIKIFDWHKRTFLHPTTKLLIYVISIFILFIIIFNYHKKPYFEKKQDMLNPRAYSQAIAIDDENIFISGGINSKKNEEIGLKSAEIYNIKNNLKSIVYTMNLPHAYHSLFKMKNGNIIIADINGIEIFDVKTKRFKLLKTIPQKRYLESNSYKFAFLEDSKLIVIGGRIKSNGKKTLRGLSFVNTIEIIDIMLDKPIKKLPFEGSSFGVINLSDNELLIVGGKSSYQDKDILLKDIYILNTKNYKLQRWLELDTPISNPFVFENANNIILIGGEIFDKYEKIGNYKYLYTKVSDKIIFINKTNKNIIKKDIKKILDWKMDNAILNVTKINDNLYIIQLKLGFLHNFKMIDINNLREIKIKNKYELFGDIVYRSANVVCNGCFWVFGGKERFIEPTLESIYDIQKPYAPEENRYSVSGFVLQDVMKLNFKEGDN